MDEDKFSEKEVTNRIFFACLFLTLCVTVISISSCQTFETEAKYKYIKQKELE